MLVAESLTGRAKLAAVSVRKYPATMRVKTPISTLHPNAQGDGGDVIIVYPDGAAMQSHTAQSPQPSHRRSSKKSTFVNMHGAGAEQGRVAATKEYLLNRRVPSVDAASDATTEQSGSSNSGDEISIAAQCKHDRRAFE